MLYKKVIYRNSIKFIQIGVYEFYRPGNYVTLDNEEYIIMSSILKKERNTIINNLEIIKASNINIEYIVNSNIRGSSIEARVLKLVNKNGKAYMEVDFEYGLNKRNKGDQTKNLNNIAIPYKTFYSKSNTGLFPTPEINDVVDVIFYGDDEKDVKVSWSIENEESDRFNDGSNRNYISKNFEFKLENDNLLISANNKIDFNSQNISLLSKNIFLKSKEAFAVASEKYIALESKTDFSIYGDEIKIKSIKDNIKLISNKDLFLKGKNIHND